MKNILPLLTTWGNSQQQTPENNLALKNQILAQLDMLPPKTNKQAFSLPWLSLAFGSLAIILVIAQVSTSNSTPTFSQVSNRQTHSPALNQSKQKEVIKTQDLTERGSSLSNSAPSQDYSLRESKLDNSEIFTKKSHSSFAPEPYLPTPLSVPISDNRQFLKTDYTALIKTRKTSKITAQIQTTIRGFDGRVDALNNSKNTSYISFVIPSSRLDSFKQELINLVGEKFITETISAENLLPEKQGIEKQQTQTNNTINSLNTDKDNLTKNHTSIISNLNAQIYNLTKQLKDLDTQLPSWSTEYQERQKELLNARAILQQKINIENSNYQNSLNYFNEQIKYQETVLNNLSEQNQTLLDTVDTVRGNISIQSINWLQVLNTHFSVYWLVLILLCLAGLTFYLKQKKTYTSIA